MGNFRHFQTRKEANLFLKKLHASESDRLIVVKKKGKHKKPFTVGTYLSHLHFTKDGWV